MKKSTKGAAAAAIAGVLLLGGAGSLAFWSDSVTIGGAGINSGHLSLEDTTVGSDDQVTTDDGCVNAPWTLDDGEDEENAVFVPATDDLVPGDVLTKACTFDIEAEGEHLRATLLASNDFTGELGAYTTMAPVYTINGGASSGTITEANDGQELKATMTVTFLPGSGNLSQDQTLALGNFTITATQVHD